MGFLGIALIILVVLACILIGAIGLMIAFLIAGLILKKRNKKVSAVLLTLSGIIFALLVALALYIFLPRQIEIQTPDGTQTVYSNVDHSYINAIRDGNVEKVNKLLNKYPFLIYEDKYLYYSGSNYTDGLLYATVNGNKELAECLISHGATYDNGITLENVGYDYTFEYYFGCLQNNSITDTEQPDNIDEWIQFMIDNGAAVEFTDDTDTPNALFCAVEYICDDGVISDEDVRVIDILIANGAKITDTEHDVYTYNSRNHTEAQYDIYTLSDMYNYCTDENEVDMNSENAKRVAELLCN